jgi:hypothetical protein
MLVRDSNGPLWGRKSLRSLLVLDSNNRTCRRPRFCPIPQAIFGSTQLPESRCVQFSNNPENGRVKTATPPMCNSPLSIGGALFLSSKSATEKFPISALPEPVTSFTLLVLAH